jgi:transcriptional regulator with XRE-family HTH domain
MVLAQMAKRKIAHVTGASLRLRREKLELTQGELARLSGIEQQDISRIELENVKGGETKLRLIAFLERLEGLQATKANDMTPKRLTGLQVVHGVSGGAIYDLPLYRPYLAEGGSMAVPAEPDGQIKRPDYLVNKDGSYAIEMVGDGMSPKFEDRDILYVDPSVSPELGKPCIFLSPMRDFAQVLILVDKTEHIWRVRHASKDTPAFELDRTAWPICEAVQGVYSPHIRGIQD